MKLYPKVTTLFCIWTVSLLTICYFGFSTLPHSGLFSSDFIKSFSNWDGGHFLGIAQHGYQEKFQYAFFPLYPLVIKAVSQLTQNSLIAALLISIVSSFLGLHILYKLLQIDFDKKLAEKAVLVLLFFPTSFYFLTAYSEGLFFLLVAATFYFLRQHKLFLATIAVSLASATRLTGLALVLGVLIQVQTTTGINRKNLYILLSPLGFLLYSWYLLNQTGDPLYFITAENHWQRTLSIPGLGFWETLRSISNIGFITANFNIFLDLVFAIFGVGMAVRTLRFLPSAYSIYSLVSIGIPLFTPSLSSMPRFLLPILPIFVLVSLIKNQYLFLAYQIISLMLLSVFTILFVNGFWVS